MKKMTILIILFVVGVVNAQFAGGSRSRYSGPITAADIKYENARVIEAGADLDDKYNWLASSDRNGAMGALSASNRRTLLLTPGKYNITTALTMDTNYVDLVSISGNPEDTVITSDGSIELLAVSADCFIGGIHFYNPAKNSAITDTGTVVWAGCMVTERRTLQALTYDHTAGTVEKMLGGGTVYDIIGNVQVADTIRITNTGDSTNMTVGNYTVASIDATNGIYVGLSGSPGSGDDTGITAEIGTITYPKPRLPISMNYDKGLGTVAAPSRYTVKNLPFTPVHTIDCATFENKTADLTKWRLGPTNYAGVHGGDQSLARPTLITVYDVDFDDTGHASGHDYTFYGTHGDFVGVEAGDVITLTTDGDGNHLTTGDYTISIVDTTDYNWISVSADPGDGSDDTDIDMTIPQVNRSVKMVCTSGGQTSFISYFPTTNLDIRNLNFVVRYYAHEGTEGGADYWDDIYNLKLRLYDGSAKIRTFLIGGDSPWQVGWNVVMGCLEFHQGDNGFDPSDLDYIKLEIDKGSGNDSNTPSITLDFLQFIPPFTQGVLLLRYDDAATEQLRPLAYMNQLGLRGFVGAHHDDNNQGMSITNLQDLQDYANHNIVSHGYTDLHWRYVTNPEEWKSLYLDNLAYFESNGLISGSRVHVTSGGFWPVGARAATRGMIDMLVHASSFGVGSSSHPTNLYSFEYLIGSAWGINDLENAGELETYIDKVCTYGGVACIYMHTVFMTDASFDYIAAKRDSGELMVLTPSDLMTGTGIPTIAQGYYPILTDYTVPAAFCQGATFTNAGAGAAVEFTLPAAERGMTVTFCRTEAAETKDILLTADGAETIDGADLDNTADEVATVTLECFVDGSWISTINTGTWN